MVAHGAPQQPEPLASVADTCLLLPEGAVQHACGTGHQTSGSEQAHKLTLMALRKTSLLRRKCAVGPSGRCTTTRPLTVLLSSLNTITSVKSRLAAYWQIFFRGYPCMHSESLEPALRCSCVVPMLDVALLDCRMARVSLNRLGSAALHVQTPLSHGSSAWDCCASALTVPMAYHSMNRAVHIHNKHFTRKAHVSVVANRHR